MRFVLRGSLDYTAELFDVDKKHKLSDEFALAVCGLRDPNNPSRGGPGPGACGYRAEGDSESYVWHIHGPSGILVLHDCDVIVKVTARSAATSKSVFYAYRPAFVLQTFAPADDDDAAKEFFNWLITEVKNRG